MIQDSLILMASWQVKGLQLFFSLSLLVILHEFGHFIFAKMFKTRVERFYLFFDFLFPFSNVLPFSLFKKKIGDTQYGIGWFPLGGYVKIAGMVDESMDKEALKQPPQPWEFRSKKAWQRLLIMLGGIIVNILTAWAIYAMIFANYGEQYLATKDAHYGIAVDSLGESIGLKDGDKILSVGGKQVERFNNIPLEIMLENSKTIEVERDGSPVTVPIPEGTIKAILKSKKSTLLGVRIPAVVGSVGENSKAAKAGLKVKDSIIAINGQSVIYWDQFQDAKKAHDNIPMDITVIRDGAEQHIQVQVSKDSLLGFGVADASQYIKMTNIKYGFFEALGKGASHTIDQFVFYWKQFKMMFTSKEVKLSESLGGMGSFASIFPEEFSWETFWKLTAFISIILAFMNLLPIPGLDGGYVMFLLFEMITGKKVSEKVMETTTSIGLILLLALMLYANGLDIFRALK